jgi:complex III assembly factor LYRM7
MPLLIAARQQARGEFMRNASLSPEDPGLEKAISHAEEVAKILRENIVQGENQGNNKYSEF